MFSRKRPYLIENRLADVLALIQVLSLDKYGHRSEDGLQHELQGNPKSAKSWIHLAHGHPEFFRVDPSQDAQLSLVARHVTERNGNGLKEISPDLVKTLIQIAIELHDRQKEKSERWKVWLPLIVAVITVMSSFYVQYDNNQNQSDLKHYEVELKPKQEGYTNFMNAISKSYFAAATSNSLEITKSLEQAENSFYIIEPFLSDYDRNRIWNEFQNYTSLCYSILEYEKLRKDEKKTYESYNHFREFFRQNLFEALFSSKGVIKK